MKFVTRHLKNCALIYSELRGYIKITHSLPEYSVIITTYFTNAFISHTCLKDLPDDILDLDLLHQLLPVLRFEADWAFNIKNQSINQLIRSCAE